MMNTPREVKDKVEHCLKCFGETREDDSLLIISVLSSFYKYHFMDLLARSMVNLGLPVPFIIRKENRENGHYKKLPSSETITRIRRKFNNEGKYLPKNPDVLRNRGFKIKEFQEFNRNF